MEIKLKSGRVIGEGQSPYVIAEIGSNWHTLEDCMNSISQAKMCGADAVKFQFYKFGALFADMKGITTNYCGSMPSQWLPKLKEKSEAVGIDFMCSSFSPELLEEVDKYVEVHKVASSEMCHLQMLEKLRKIGKPVFLSTGAQHKEDILRAIQTLGDTPVVAMYCPAAYPAKHYNPMAFEAFKEFSPLVGFSDHTLDVYCAPTVAMTEGVCVIEKHANFVDAHGPDAPHSLNGEDFKEMVKAIRGGLPNWTGPTPPEEAFITMHKRRLIATQDIQEGQVLQLGSNFGIYRSLKEETRAFSPWMTYEVNGKTTKKPIKAGDGIGPGDL